MEQNNNYIQQQPQEEEEVSFLDVFFHYFRHWKWFILSVVLCMAIAWVYLRYATPEYKVSSKVLIKDEKKGQTVADLSAFSDLGIISHSSSLDNEIEVLKSKTLMQQVKNNLNLGVSYIKEGRIRQVDIYDQTPVFVRVVDQLKSGGFSLSLVEGNKLRIDSELEEFSHTIDIPDEWEDPSVKILPDTIVSPWGLLTFQLNHFSDVRQLPIDVVIADPKSLPVVDISAINKTSSVVDISMVTPNPKKGQDIVNTLIQVYNNQVIEEQRYVASNTIKFIDERLSVISGELKSAELDVERYRQAEGVTNLDAQAQLFLSSSSEYDQKISDTQMQLNILQGIKQWIMNPSNEGEAAPSNVGLTDQTILNLINVYNQEIMEKRRTTIGMTESNPIVIEFNARIGTMRDNLIRGINMAESGLQTSLNELRRKENVYVSKARSLPTQERETRELYRQQSIKESLVLYLMQKQEETGLSLAMAVPNAVVIDPANFSDIPVKPKRMIIYLAAFILGLVIPVVIIYILGLFDNKIHSKEDIQRIVKAPYLGDIPENKKDRIFPVQNVRSASAEKFRIITSNLRFVIGDQKHKVIMVTSTFPDEGKSFVSRNLAYSLASIGHKVLLIDSDMRRSVLNQTLQMDANKGIAYFLSTPDATLKEVTEHKEFHPNLSILPVKAFPPNPAELVASPRFAELIEVAREKYDYVVVDTAPVGLVADAFTINQYANATVFVTRAEVTYKHSLKEIQTYYRDQKLNSLSIVLNAVSAHRGYGYGYGNYGSYNSKYYVEAD